MKKPTLDEIQECQIILNRTRMAFTEKLPLLSPFQNYSILLFSIYRVFLEFIQKMFHNPTPNHLDSLQIASSSLLLPFFAPINLPPTPLSTQLRQTRMGRSHIKAPHYTNYPSKISLCSYYLLKKRLLC